MLSATYDRFILIVLNLFSQWLIFYLSVTKMKSHKAHKENKLFFAVIIELCLITKDTYINAGFQNI